MAAEVTFTPTEDDYVCASQAWYLRHMRGKGGRRFAGSCLATTALGGASIGGFQGDVLTAVSYAIATSAIALLIIPLFIGFSYLLIPRRARRLYRQQKTLHSPIWYGWSASGISFRSSSGEGRYGWRDLHRWGEARGTFLFLLNDCLFLFLPRRFLTEDAAEDLRTTARAEGPPCF